MWVPFVDVRACTTLGKTATAAKINNVTRVPRTLGFDIFISLKGINEDGCGQHEHLSRPRAKDRSELSGLELHLISGWYPNQKSNASYVSECVIVTGRANH